MALDMYLNKGGNAMKRWRFKEKMMMLVGVITFLSAGSVAASVMAEDIESSVILFTVPDEIEVSLSMGDEMLGGIGGTEFQIGENVGLSLGATWLRAGDFPALADDVTFIVSSEADEVIWTQSIGGPVGEGWTRGPGGGWGTGVGWNQVDNLANSVNAGIYKVGVVLTNPAYSVPADYTGVIQITVVDGTWMFRHSQEELGSGAIAMVAGDINNDGFADLIFHGENNKVYMNNGDGNFNFAYAFSDSSGQHSRCLRLGDLNGDGSLDLVEGLYGYPASHGGYPNTEIRVYLNDGTGVFSEPSSIPLSRVPVSYWDGSQFMTLGDIDGDSDLDIVIAFTDQSKVHLYFNDGAGSFSASPQELASRYVKSPILGDLDGDGDLDLITANSENQANKVWMNDGAGTFTKTEQSLGSSYTYAGSVGDIDNDGDLDFIAGNIAAPQKVYLNDGQGVFSFWYSFQETDRSYSHPVLLEDLDNDGDLDMLTAGDKTYVYENDGTGVFTPNTYSLIGTSGLNGDAALVDVDNDGDSDLITAGWENKLYYNETAPLDSCGCGLSLSANVWTMFSVPCIPPSGSATVNDQLNGDLGTGAAYDLTWVMFRWNSATESYEQVQATDPLEQGVGYWIYSKQAGTLKIDNGTHTTDGATPVSGEDGYYDDCSDYGWIGQPCYKIDLTPPTLAEGTKWNLIGYPFVRNTDWAAVHVAYSENNGATWLDAGTPSAADTSGYISKNGYVYNNSGSAYNVFDDTVSSPSPGILQPNKSYWIMSRFVSGVTNLALLAPAPSL
ncbi:MAG: VCBS repeat-containing protein [Candidatus Electrothrix sp. AU1_5]|nr:VCBS repeat-containing protein [Candidatus Electrothrix gigas]